MKLINKFIVHDYTFKIYEIDHEQFKVKILYKYTQTSEWLNNPASIFETESGCAWGILVFLNNIYE